MAAIRGSAIRRDHEGVGRRMEAFNDDFRRLINLADPGPEGGSGGCAVQADMTLRVWGSLTLMVERMRAAARKWDVTLSPNCDL
ncbi:hypothetical protein WCE34_02910 [Luteimonas sp. MJ204]|uniref:hypothetical protein n=1 Tax=Luteimonas sp. MJ145 TaxID=3129234 RepID=UPI0031BB0462